MHDREFLDDIRNNIFSEIADRPAPSTEYMKVDRWVSSSALQKAIRRGDRQTALSAGSRYLGLDTTSFWRRLPIIAPEDVGIGADQVVLEVLVGAASASHRTKTSSPWPLAAFLIERMCVVPKDRSTAALLQAALSHPELGHICKSFGGRGVQDLLRMVADCGAPLAQRAVAALYAAGTTSLKDERLIHRRGDIAALFGYFDAMGLPRQLSTALKDAAHRARFSLSTLLALAWVDMQQYEAVRTLRHDLGTTRIAECVPLYAIDKHTAMGTRVLAKFSSRVPAVAQFLAEHDYIPRPAAAVGLAVFYAEGGLLGEQLIWRRTEEMSVLEREADSATIKMEPAALSELTQIVRDHLEELNDLRETELLRSLAKAAARKGETR